MRVRRRLLKPLARELADAKMPPQRLLEQELGRAQRMCQSKLAQGLRNGRRRRPMMSGRESADAPRALLALPGRVRARLLLLRHQVAARLLPRLNCREWLQQRLT